MRAFLAWYVIVGGLGLLAFLLVRPLCERLPDRGYSLSKILGVLLFGTTLWLGTALGLLRNGPGGALATCLALFITTPIVLLRARSRGSRPGTRALSPPIRIIVSIEVLFLAAFGGWCFLRAHDPAVTHTEQPMDLMMLTATSVTRTLPPLDPWLAGHPIGYYYLGYWLLGAPSQLAGIAPEVTYNVGQACWFGLLVVGCSTSRAGGCTGARLSAAIRPGGGGAPAAPSETSTSPATPSS
jgi:uncharacterized membrane protein